MKPPGAIALIFAGVLLLAGALILLAWKLENDAESRVDSADLRIGEDVVATYAGGEITAGELRDYIGRMVLRNGEHEVCEKHGLDHSRCDRSEACETHPLGSAESYRMFLQQMVIEKTVDRWIKEKGMLARKDVTHRLKHLVEEINLNSLAGKMHSDRLKPDRVEMRQYYEEHRDEFGERPFPEVEEEIEMTLVARKQAEYIPKYIEQLKQNAVIERNYDLLSVPEPREADLRSYYEEHREEFRRPEAVRVEFMEFRIDGDGRVTRETAEKALSRVRSGGDFAKVAQELANGSATTEYIERSPGSGKGAGFLETVFRYRRGEVTPVFEDNRTLYVARIIEHLGEELKPLDTVRGEVKRAVYGQRVREKMDGNRYEALFSIHGKRFTVEEFRQEFDELSPEEQEQFATFEAKKNLLDQLIVRELLLEKAEDQEEGAKEKEAREDLKRSALEQMLHREEVDEKITVSDDEAREFYEAYQDRIIEPAKAKVSIIRVDQGVGDDERERARNRIEEARAKLAEGAAFGDVAKSYSEDWTATRGGEQDRWIYEGASHLGERFEHDFHEVVFSLKPGEISDVFTFRNNFWIVKLRQRAEARTQTFEEAKSRIVEILKSVRHEDRMYELQNELLEKSRLVVRDYVLSRLMSAEERLHQAERRSGGR